MAGDESRKVSNEGAHVRQFVLPIIVAALSGAVTSYLAIPAAIAKIETTQIEHENRLDDHDTSLRGVTPGAQAALAELKARIDAHERWQNENSARLLRIEQQNDEILRRLPR